MREIPSTPSLSDPRDFLLLIKSIYFPLLFCIVFSSYVPSAFLSFPNYLLLQSFQKRRAYKNITGQSSAQTTPRLPPQPKSSTKKTPARLPKLDLEVADDFKESAPSGSPAGVKARLDAKAYPSPHKVASSCDASLFHLLLLSCSLSSSPSLSFPIPSSFPPPSSLPFRSLVVRMGHQLIKLFSTALKK